MSSPSTEYALHANNSITSFTPLMRPLSPFGQQLGVATGIGELMDDLGAALSNKSDDLCMLGGGQPAYIPKAAKLFQEHALNALASPEQLHSIMGEYDPAEGNQEFCQSFAEMMNESFGWEISAENVGISSGGQSACFHLFNALVGAGEHILIPLLPDYMGYRDQLVSGAQFLGIHGIPHRDANSFKYRLNLEAVQSAPDSTRLMALSRPTNPSGNVLSDEEVEALSDECLRRNIPLLIDHAYGAPFPNAVYVPTQNIWKPHHIHIYSLSKLGLPGSRTSIIVAAPDIIHLMRNMTAVTSLANPSLGQSIVLPLIQQRTLLPLCLETILPFYRQKRDHAISTLNRLLYDRVDYAIHAAEGAFFLWIWFPSLPITSRELTSILKKRGVLAISGHWFFFGSHDRPAHHDQCLRITYSMNPNVIEKGLQILADTILELHDENPSN